MTLLRIALKSARFRKTSLILTIVSIAISVSLLLGVDVVRKEAKSSFVNTISQTDLIVGARSGPTNLLLYSVFHIGSATNNVTWESYETIAARDEVAWTVPISLGDSQLAVNFSSVPTKMCIVWPSMSATTRMMESCGILTFLARPTRDSWPEDE